MRTLKANSIEQTIDSDFFKRRVKNEGNVGFRQLEHQKLLSTEFFCDF